MNLAFAGSAVIGTNFSISGAGFNPATGSFVIPAGTASVQLTVTSIDDLIFGPPQISTMISIASATNATPAGGPATVFFNQGDPAPTVNLSPAALTIPEAGGTGIVTVTLSAVSAVDTTVTLSFSGAAVLGTNFDTSINGEPIDSTTLTIPAGSLTGQVTLTGKLDGVYGPDLTMTVGIASVVNGVAGGSTVAVTLKQGEPKPIVTLSPATSTMAELGGSTTVTATQNEISAADTTLLIVYGGTAAVGTVFTVSGNNYTAATGSLVIPAGQLSATITLTGLNKPTFGNNLTAIVSIQSVANGVVQGNPTSTVTINEGSPGPAVSLAVTGSPMAELGGQALVTASIPAPITNDVQVFLGFTGTAALGVNFTA